MDLELFTIKKQVTCIAPLNRLPLLPSGPGGVQQELVVQDLPARS